MAGTLIQEALKKRVFSEHPLILVRVFSIRKHTFSYQGVLFKVCSPEKCQQISMPSSLKTLISIRFNEPNMKIKKNSSLKS